jgi:GDSL-like Lipase/Acylhydrolase family
MKITKWTANAALAVSSLFVALLCAEGILRMFYPQPLGVWYSLRDGLVIHPPELSVYLNQFDRTVQFNSIGMRDREHAVPKDNGTFRVLLLGDSFMEALQVDFEDSFPKLLEDRLRQASHRTVEVINCAVSGWGTDQELIYLQQYGLKFHSDLILIGMTIHNDVSDNLEGHFHTLVDGKMLPKPKQEMPWFEYRSLKVKDFLASHSHLTQLLRKYKYRRGLATAAQSLDTHLLQLVRREESAQLGMGWEMTYQLFKQMQEAGKGIGAETAIFLIPLSIQLYDQALTSFIRTHDVSRDDISLERPQEKMRQFGNSLGIQIIDLLPNFREWVQRHQRSLHVGDGHWNAEGHRIAADVVSEQLLKKGVFSSQQ